MERPDGNWAREFAGMVRGMATLPALAFNWGQLPRGVGQPVLVLPGYMTGDWATLVLRRFLNQLGYRAYGWGLGKNHGNLGKLVKPIADRIVKIADSSGQRVKLVGWSHGGIVAREASRLVGERIEQIVTMGTPVIGGPRYTFSAQHYIDRGIDLHELERKSRERNAIPLTVPITAVYSKNDGIVFWRACIDPNPHNRIVHIEVQATHAEMGFSTDVFRIIAHELRG